MNNKTLMGTLSALSLWLLVNVPALAQVTPSDWNQDPASAIGPTFWGNLPAEPAVAVGPLPFATCGASDTSILDLVTVNVGEVGRKQSPVDIIPADAVPATLPALDFQYAPTAFEVENNGHAIEVPYEEGSFLQVGVDEYELIQFHFHAPSEHTVDSVPYDMELHLVHRNILGDLAVVGVLLQAAPNPNRTAAEIMRIAPLQEGVAIGTGLINAQDLLPPQTDYYRYSGSLTTPPCSEGVSWFVLKQPVNVNQATVNRLRNIISLFPAYDGYSQNNRPVRPLNGRAVLDRVAQ